MALIAPHLINECNELTACSFINWYKIFKKISIPSKYILIPLNVKNYLLEDIIILPKECNEYTHTYSSTSRTYGHITINNNDDQYAYDDDHDYDDDDNDDDDDDDDDNNDSALSMIQPKFDNFSSLITNIIKNELNGSAFIKTNWHCPKDAFWITAKRSLQCEDITDVYQLLKASMICHSDMEYYGLSLDYQNTVHDYDTNQYLIFKKWIDIDTYTEFRCFVRKQQLIAISPRDYPQYHLYIKEEKLGIISDIKTMFKEHIKNRFPLKNYVFDVVRVQKDQIKVLDFSPFNKKYCDALAFRWTELMNDDMLTDDDEPEFRYVQQECGIQPRIRMKYGVPFDVIQMFDIESHQDEQSINEHQSINDYDEPFNFDIEHLSSLATESLNILQHNNDDDAD